MGSRGALSRSKCLSTAAPYLPKTERECVCVWRESVWGLPCACKFEDDCFKRGVWSDRHWWAHYLKKVTHFECKDEHTHTHTHRKRKRKGKERTDLVGIAIPFFDVVDDWHEQAIELFL